MTPARGERRTSRPTARRLRGRRRPPAVELVTPTSSRGAADVPVDTALAVDAEGGTLDAVDGDLRGRRARRRRCRATAPAGPPTDRLEPGTTYAVTTVGRPARTASRSPARRRFSTQDLTLDQQTYPSVAPLAGRDRRRRHAGDRHLRPAGDRQGGVREAHGGHLHARSRRAPGTGSATPRRTGARRRTGRPAPTSTSTSTSTASPAGDGIYGQESRELDFHVGDAHVYKVNAQTHQMKVFSNGKLLRTIPITTGERRRSPPAPASR